MCYTENTIPTIQNPTAGRSATIVRCLAFTLVELLIAMTITLLLMAALARSFGSISRSIEVGRSQVSLSGKLRGTSFRLRSDLASRTVDVKPPVSTQSGAGYFMYYEGPLTEQTFSLFGAEPTRRSTDGETEVPGNANYNDVESGPTYRRHSRFGDFDDYIAFTAEASGEEWFTGKVPAYLIEDGLTGDAAMEPRVIRSKFAEIIIWAAPQWSVDPESNDLDVAAHANGGMPLYEDVDNDLVPDRIVLHQRILLIRPDLNRRRAIPGGNFSSNVLRPQNDSVNPFQIPPALHKIYPIGIDNPLATGVDASTLLPNYASVASLTDTPSMFACNWLTGMAPMHHFYDLSLRRVIHPQTGEPTGYVAANSLQDLVQPHNRFAHVRYPGRYFGRGTSITDNATSMPLLALGWNDAILNWQGVDDPRGDNLTSAPAWLPTGHPSPRTLNTAGTGTVADDSRSGLFNGWLLPHFELGDANPPGTSGGDHWERNFLRQNFQDPRWDRSGEDVLQSNVLAFDIRVFDDNAPVFLTSGPDGAPGVAGVDDDLSAADGGTTDQTDNLFGDARSELGAAGSDDVIVEVNDIAIYDVMGSAAAGNERILHPLIASTFAGDFIALGSEGSFVDLAYPMLAGSPLRERLAASLEAGEVSSPPNTAVAVNDDVRDNFNLFMDSDFSMVPMPTPAVANSLTPMKRSGKLVHFNTAGQICFFQPTYDTWTDSYEFDGFDQSPTINGSVSGATQFGTTWLLNNLPTSVLPPIPRLVAASPLQARLQVDTGRFIPEQPETEPPFPIDLSAISITVRMQDASGEMSQVRVVEALQ
jgi:type II secretory pathway pseudopilin PulG